MTLVWTIFSFMVGAIPFPILIGKYALGKDIRQYGDKNPGATNVLRAGGFFWYALALILEISKGAFPVGLAHQIYGIQDWRIIPIALGPTLGNAFSPFLNFKGGKALAASLGAWIGLTIWKIPLVAIVTIIIATYFLSPHGWSVVVTLIAIGIGVIFLMNTPVLIGFWIVQSLLLLFTHRKDLAQPPKLGIRRHI